MLSITEAAKKARESVKIVKIAPKSYVLRSWDSERRAWIESPAGGYAIARRSLTQVRHKVALQYLGWDSFDAEGGIVYRSRTS